MCAINHCVGRLIHVCMGGCCVVALADKACSLWHNGTSDGNNTNQTALPVNGTG